eukprot:181736-Pleurochrysis_carterae.AAC.1
MLLLEANEDANDLEDGDSAASTAAAFGAARLSEAEAQARAAPLHWLRVDRGGGGGIRGGGCRWQ